MQLEIPDGLLLGVKVSESDLRLDLALGLFIDRRMSLSRAAKVAGFNVPAFMHELGKRRIPIHYGDEDLSSDIKAAHLLREERDEGLRQRRLGGAKGTLVSIADDFDAPIEDFKDYM